jgi:hypothetical protein
MGVALDRSYSLEVGRLVALTHPLLHAHSRRQLEPAPSTVEESGGEYGLTDDAVDTDVENVWQSREGYGR